MKKIYLLLLAVFTCFTLSAQFEINGSCFDTNLTLTQTADVDGKPSYQGPASYMGNPGTAELRWVAVNSAWVLYWNGNPMIFNTDDTAVPPASVSGTWANAGLCPVVPTVVDVALPVSWAYFNGTRFGKTSVQLQWGTFEEIDNAGYYVERSTDGLNWQQLGFVPATESRSAAAEYGYLDRQPVHGENFYRLQQEDFTGSTSYSEVVQVAFSIEEGENGLVSPNPANNEIAFFGPAEPGVLTILSQHGQVVRRITNYSPGASISVGDLPANLYVLQFENDKSQISKKVIIH
jgi:hypothetical protein